VTPPTTIGVVGLGRWGPQLAKAFSDIPQATVRWLCDADRDALMRMRRVYPSLRYSTDLQALLDDDGLEAVVLATPSATHHELALAALQAGKHVLVETPLALRREHAEELVVEARRRNRCLMVGHVVLFHPAIRKLRELIDTGALGKVYYLAANRQSLERPGEREGALWRLGVHEVAVVLYLLGEAPLEVSAYGDSYLQGAQPDVAFCHLRFPSGTSAHLHISSIDAHTVQRLSVVGSRRMAVVDDLRIDQQLTLYEGSAHRHRDESGSRYPRFGEVTAPQLPGDDPLRLECEHFASTIRSSSYSAGNSTAGAAVVRVLDSLQRSLDGAGTPVPLGHAPAPSRPPALLRAVDSHGFA
jgi:predicted dehydrogenase